MPIEDQGSNAFEWLGGLYAAAILAWNTWINWQVSDLRHRVEDEMDSQRKEIAQANDRLRERIERLIEQLADFKLETERTRVSKTDLSAMEVRLTTAIHKTPPNNNR